MGAARRVTPRKGEQMRYGSGTLRAMLLAGLVLASVGPLLVLVAQSLSEAWFFPALAPRARSLAGWRSLVDGDAIASSMLTSLTLGSLTGVVACAIALPIGRTVSRLHGWRRHVAAAAAFLPVATPPLALGTGLQVLLLAAGIGGTSAGVLFAHLVPATGYLTLLFLGTFTLFDSRVEEEARTLGATAWQTWWRVTMPLLRTQIVEAVMVGFLISWSQFALTLVVGGGAVRALPLEVFAFVRSGQDRAAAVGSLVLILPPVLAFTALRWATRRTVVRAQ